MAITRQSFAADTASLLQQTYQQKWLPTNWESSAAPKLPAGMTLYIGGVPYVVDTEDYTLGGTPSDGICYIKITPNSGDGGATADAVLTNTFSGTWNEAWNDFYDSTAIFLNFFCTKSGSNYTAKGQWLNYRERKILVKTDVFDELKTSGNVYGTDGQFTGNVSGVDANFTGNILSANNVILKNSSTHTIISISSGTPYILPAGLYHIALGANTRCQVFINGAWRDMDGVTSGDLVFAFSDGTNTRLICFSGTVESTLRKY